MTPSSYSGPDSDGNFGSLPLNINTITGVPSKILIVDDEPDILEELAECLEDEGFEWVSAQNGESALKCVEDDETIGVVVTDIRMPGMDGLALSRTLLEKHAFARDLVVIVVTGHAGMREAIEALQIGAEDFLTKPISPDHLLHSVRRAEEMIHLRSSERLFKERLKQEVEDKTEDVRRLADNLEQQNQELVAKNEELNVVNRLKGEFLQMINHELNTPLNAISGFSHLLLHNPAVINDPGASANVKYICSGVRRLSKVVESVLSMAELTGGGASLAASTFSSDDVLSSAEEHFAKTLAGHDLDPEFEAEGNLANATLQCISSGEPFDLEADFSRLRSVIDRLLENGVKHGGGELTLTAYQEGDMACFAVSDNGQGMTEEEIDIALTPMRQVDGSTKRRVEGIGLGLSLAKGIVELHGGRLSVEDTSGGGTTVVVSVPRKILTNGTSNDAGE